MRWLSIGLVVITAFVGIIFAPMFYPSSEDSQLVSQSYCTVVRKPAVGVVGTMECGWIEDLPRWMWEELKTEHTYPAEYNKEGKIVGLALE